MPEKDLKAVLAGLQSPDHVEMIPFLRALGGAAAAKKEPQAKGPSFAEILTLIAQYGPLISAFVALVKSASGGGAGEAGKLPGVPDAQPELPSQDDEDEDEPTKPVPAARSIAGVHTARWFHFGEGDPGKVKDMDHARFKAITSGADPLNGDLKSRLVADVTPKLSDGTKLLKGMPENAQVQARYAIEFDGTRYEGDEIKNSPVVLNNLDANVRLTPRFVMGPGIAGKHTFAAFVNLNDTGWQQIGETLRIG